MKKSSPSQYLQHYYPDANIPGRSAASCRSILNHIPLPLLLVVTPRAVLAFSRTLLNIHECDVIRHDALATYGCLDESDNDEGSIQLNVRGLSLIDKWIHFMVLSAYRTEVYSLGAVSQIQNILEIMHSIPDSNRTASLYAIIRTCRNHITTLA